MTPVLLRQLRHDVWATEQLLAHCRTLPGEQLERTLPGTYGTVRATLAHIVSSDEGYLTRLLGLRLHDQPFRPGDHVTLDELASHLGHVRDGVERLFSAGAVDGDRLITDTPLRRPDQPRFEMAAWVPLTQFVHHGNDHRSQVATILSANGVPGPDLQVWPYAIALGASREATEGYGLSDLAVPIDYDNWATEKLVQFCISLTPEQRALTTPGTMGTVEATLIHLIAAKERYAAALQGVPPPAEAVRESTTKDLAHVATRAKLLSDWFAGVAREDLDLDRIIERQAADGSTQKMPMSILIAQFLHHGNEHRAQLGSIFGANGIGPPHYSAFDWGRERGLLSS